MPTLTTGMSFLSNWLGKLWVIGACTGETVDLVTAVTFEEVEERDWKDEALPFDSNFIIEEGLGDRDGDGEGEGVLLLYPLDQDNRGCS